MWFGYYQSIDERTITVVDTVRVPIPDVSFVHTVINDMVVPGIFPVPACDVLNIHSVMEEIITDLRMFTMAGQLVGYFNPNSLAFVIPVKDLANRNYLLWWQTDRGVCRQQVLVAH